MEGVGGLAGSPGQRPRAACLTGPPKEGQPGEGRGTGPRWQTSLLLPSSPGCPHAPLLAQAKTRHLLSHAGLPGLALLPADVAMPVTTQARTLQHSPRAQAPHTPPSLPLSPSLLHTHSRSLPCQHRPRLGPGPPPLWASSPLGSMNNSLLSLWASNIYPLRFPALSSRGEGPALAPPSLSPHPTACPGSLRPSGGSGLHVPRGQRRDLRSSAPLVCRNQAKSSSHLQS